MDKDNVDPGDMSGVANFRREILNALHGDESMTYDKDDTEEVAVTNTIKIPDKKTMIHITNCTVNIYITK